MKYSTRLHIIAAFVLLCAGIAAYCGNTGTGIGLVITAAMLEVANLIMIWEGNDDGL